MQMTPHKKITEENRRVRKCLSLDPQVWNQFNSICKGRDAIPSRVIERFLIRQVNAI